MKIYLDSIGCRLNQAEIEQFARQFQANGHTLVPTAEDADLAVINTCAVTAAAESDSRQKIRQVGREGASQVVVTGCWSTLKPAEAANFPGVSQVVGNSDKDRLVAEVLHIPVELFDQEPLERLLLPGARQRTRAFIKVQDGCDNRCTFCVTTLARGASRSRNLEEILSEIRTLTGSLSSGDNAAQEVVLSGVHLGSWGHDFDPPQRLFDLVKSILEHSEVARLRLSSLEPWDLDSQFFDLWQDRRLCRHLHLPLQSGSAATLRRMARKTTPQSYAELITAARRAIPGVAITTDLIAGFPGESEAEFEETLAFVRAMNFAGGHVFTYSARPGTAAARMPGQIRESLRKERSARLRAVLAESTSQYQVEFIGQVLPVLWESATGLGPQGWQMSGLTDNYLRVQANTPLRLWNQITPVKLTALSAGGLSGVVV